MLLGCSCPALPLWKILFFQISMRYTYWYHAHANYLWMWHCHTLRIVCVSCIRINFSDVDLFNRVSSTRPGFYSSESWTLKKSLTKKINGTYTRMLWKKQNISWKKHPTIRSLWITPNHLIRHNEVAQRVLMWKPDTNRKRGRSSTTLKMVLVEDTRLEGDELVTAMQDRVNWRKKFLHVTNSVGCNWVALEDKIFTSLACVDSFPLLQTHQKHCPLTFFFIQSRIHEDISVAFDDTL